MTKEAVHKILDILNELPPTCRAVASITLKMALMGPGPIGGLLMTGGLFSPSVGEMLGMRTSMHIADESPFKGRFG